MSTPAASDQATFRPSYEALLNKHLTTPEATRTALNDIHHPLWQQLTTLFTASSDTAIHALLVDLHTRSETMYPRLLPTTKRREMPKGVPRLRRKLSQVAESRRERGAFVDWVACRVEAHYSAFSAVKNEVEKVLGSDVVVVWRDDMVETAGKPPDVVSFGYAYRMGCMAVMEIQIAEPVAAWVFDSNSRNKHMGELSMVTFKESKILYEALRDAMISGEKVKGVDPTDVATYYKNTREARGERAALDLEEIAELQILVNNRFDL